MSITFTDVNRIVLTVRSIPINGSLSCGDGVRSVDRGSTTLCSFARSFARLHVSDRVDEQTHGKEVDDTANSKELAPPCRNAASSIPVGSARGSFLLLLSLPIRDYCRRHRMRSSSTSLLLSPPLFRCMTSFANAGCCHRTRDRGEMRSPWRVRVIPSYLETRLLLLPFCLLLSDLCCFSVLCLIFKFWTLCY